MIKATAFILIGGKSQRFGSPKWQAVVNGQTVLDRIWGACDIFEYRYIVGKEKPQGMGEPFIKDRLDINAPINGLYTALKNTDTDWILLLSCDLPLIDSSIFQKLWLSKTNDIDAIVPLANNRKQVTCALFNKKILSYVEHVIHRSKFGLFSLLKELETIEINFNDDKRFWNMNTQKDYREIVRSHFIKRIE